GEIPSLHIAQLAQGLPQFLHENGRPGSGGGSQDPDAVDFPRLLRLGGARRYQTAKREGQDDPNGATPHGALLLSAHGLLGGLSPLALPPLARYPPHDQGHTALGYIRLCCVSNHGGWVALPTLMER